MGIDYLLDKDWDFANEKTRLIINSLCKYGLALLVMNYMPVAMNVGKSITAYSVVDTSISGFKNVIGEPNLLLTIVGSVFSSVNQVFTIILSVMLVVYLAKTVISLGKYIKNCKDLKVK
jgi:hypothetical protein